MAMEEIVVKLGIDSSGFVRVLGETDQALKKTTGIVSELADKLAGFLTIAALTKLAKDAIDYASNMTDAADATRTGVEEYQVLAQAARESGASMQQLDQALIKSTLSGEKAAEGNKELQKSFAALNIDVAAFNQLPTERKLETLGKAYVDAGRSQEAYAAMAEILGTKSAPRLISALEQLGREGFDTVRAKAEEAGVVLNKVDAMKLDRLADAITSWKVKTLVVIDEAISAWDRFFQWLGGKSREQIYGDELDPERAAVRQQLLREQGEADAKAYYESVERAKQQLARGDIFGAGATMQAAENTLAENRANIEQRITLILEERRAKEAEIAASRATQAQQAEQQAILDERNADTVKAIKMVEDARALLRLKELSEKERLIQLEIQHAAVQAEFDKMVESGLGTEKEKEALAKRLIDLERDIGTTKAKIADEEKQAHNDKLKAIDEEFKLLDESLDAQRKRNAERKKMEADVLDLIKEQARLQGIVDNRSYEQYGMSTADIASQGGGSTLVAWAQQEQRLAETAGRQYGELSRARARAAAGDQDAAREVARLEAMYNETESRRKDLENKVTEAQGGGTGDPVVDELVEVNKKLKDLNEKLEAK